MKMAMSESDKRKRIGRAGGEISSELDKAKGAGLQKRKRDSNWNPVQFESNVGITSYGSTQRSRTLTDHRLPYLKQV